MRQARRTRTGLAAAASLVTAGVLAAGLGVAVIATRPGAAASAAPEPGSEEDPVVTRSYVEQYVARVLQERSPGAAVPELQVVELAPGQRLIAGGGAEIVLRSGRARVVTGPQSLGGLSDLTGGRDVSRGQDVAPNHLLLVPRSDGRGVAAVTSAVLLVRGTYTIE